jgi:hypothetical protein
LPRQSFDDRLEPGRCSARYLARMAPTRCSMACPVVAFARRQGRGRPASRSRGPTSGSPLVSPALAGARRC